MHVPSLSRASRVALAVAAAAAIVVTVGAATASSDTAPSNPKHFFWAPGQNPDPQATANSATNDLIYHGGNAGPGAIGVETTPAVYLVYWGPEWAQGFTTICVKPSMFIDEPRDLPEFCRDTVRRAAGLIG